MQGKWKVLLVSLPLPNMSVIMRKWSTNLVLLFQFAIQFVLSFCVRGNLGKQQEDTLRKYCASLRRLTDETQILSNQADITLQVSEALSLMERDFPLAIQVHINRFK